MNNNLVINMVEYLFESKLKLKVNFEIYIADRKATTCI